MVKSIRKNEHKKKNKTLKDKSKTLKDKSKTLKDKSSIEEHYNYPLRSRKGPIDTNILIEANKKFNEIKKSTNRPLLLSLFRKENIDKFSNLPKDIRHYDEYHNILSKEIKEIKTKYKYQPNNDFYTYVNYGWLKEQTEQLKKNPKYYVEVDDFRIVQDNVYRELIGNVKKYIKENPNCKKAKAINSIYKCINNNTEKQGLIASKDIKKNIDHIINNESMIDMLVYLNRDEVVSWQSPLVWNVLPDEKNVKKYISHLSPPQLGIYDYFVYIEDPNDDNKTKKFKSTFKKKYLEFINKVFKVCLPDEYQDIDAMDVWNVECELLDAMGCDTIKKEDPDYYNVLTKNEIEKDYGFNWSEFCVKQGYKKEKVPNKVVVSSLNSLKCVTQLMKERWTSKEWRTWYLFINYKQLIRFEWEWTKIYFDFYGIFVKGQPIRFPKEIYPIFMLSVTFNTFLTELYVKDNYDPVKTVYVYNIVNDLKHIFIKKLERNKWLSPSTKKSAIKKLEKLEVVIGTPYSSSAVENKQALQPDPLLDYVDDNPYHNLKVLSDWKRKRFIALEGHDVIDIPEIDWSEFKMVGTQAYMVNAYYRPTSNSIYVPLAYLQKPFMDLENYGIEYNLAYMGYTLGHELSHSLDDMGSKFDENGNMNNWWTDEDRKKYKAKIKDVVKQYEEFAKRDGIEFDAEIGVGEDLADISGLALAEEYLFIHQLVNGDIPLIKDLSLKQFYIYTAIQSRQKIFDKAIPAQLKQNPHPLEKYRCNCPLTRLSIFRELYNVEKNNGMWWHNNDTIW
jgi:putative endopeptidase